MRIGRKAKEMLSRGIPLRGEDMVRAGMRRMLDNSMGKPFGITNLCGKEYHRGCDELGFRKPTDTESADIALRPDDKVPRDVCLCHHHSTLDYTGDKTESEEASAEAKNAAKALKDVFGGRFSRDA